MTKQENKIEITNSSENLKLEYDDVSPFTGNNRSR